MRFDGDGTPMIDLDINDIDITETEEGITYIWEWNPVLMKWCVIDTLDEW